MEKGSSHSVDFSVSTTRSRGGNDEEVRRVHQLAEKETKNIRLWRGIVSILILGVGAVVSLFTFLYLDAQHQKEREDSVSLSIKR